MAKWVKHITITLILVGFYQHDKAQSFTITSSKDTFLIGEPIDLTLSLNKKNQEQIIWPFLNKGDSLPDKFEVLEVLKPQPSNNNSNITTQQITITSYYPGIHDFLPLVIQDSTNVITSNPLVLHVNIVAVDTAKGFLDIEPVMQPNLSFKDKATLFWEWIKKHWYVPLAILLFIAVVLFFILGKRKKPAQEIEKPIKKKEIAADIEALSKLQKLKNNELSTQEQNKTFYVELSLTIDQYLHKRFKIDTVDKTSTEVIDLVSSHISDDKLDDLKQFYTVADLVKFAKQIPSKESSDNILNYLIQFIEDTKQVKE